jgi:hypothetical protein
LHGRWGFVLDRLVGREDGFSVGHVLLDRWFWVGGGGGEGGDLCTAVPWTKAMNAGVVSRKPGLLA